MAIPSDGEYSSLAACFALSCSVVPEVAGGDFSGSFTFTANGVHSAVDGDKQSALKLGDPATLGAFINRVTRVFPWSCVQSANEMDRSITFTAAADYPEAGITSGELLLGVQPPLAVIFE